MRRLYPDIDTGKLAARLERTVISIYQRAQIAGIKKSAAYDARKKAAERVRLRDSGIGHRFMKGHVPANAGLRRPGFAPGRMRETQFKKGRQPSEARNYRPIGTLRISRDGLLERKVTDDTSVYPARRWIGVHRLVWSEANGPIPAGFAVVFKPGSATTELAKITIASIELVTRAELMRRNSYHTNYPKPIKRLIQLRGALQRSINNRAKKQGNGHQK